MKRILTIFAVSMDAALALVSCQREERFGDASRGPSKNTITVNFTASDINTKAAFGEFDADTQLYPTFWTSVDDKICLSLNMNDPVYGDVIKTEEVSPTADFTGTFEDTGAPYKFYALTPVSCVNGMSESRASWSVSIPVSQTPKTDGLSCDENAMLLFAESDELDAIPESTISMHLRHVPAYCRLALKNLDVAFSDFGIVDPVVSSVDVSYAIPVAGDWYINVSDGSLEPRDASHTISIKASIEDLSQPTDLWFALAPVVLDGQKVKVSVNTDKGRLSREYTFGTRTYVAGTVNKLSLDMTKNSTFDISSYSYDEDVYEMVASPSDIAAGDEVIFADAAEPTIAMSQTFSSGSFSSVALDADDGFAYTPSDGYVRLSDGSNAMVWTINSKSGNAVTFKSGNNYLNTTGSRTSMALSLSTSSGRSFTLYDFGEGKLGVYFSAKSGNTTYYYSVAISTTDKFFLHYETSASIGACYMFKKKSVTTTVSMDFDDAPILQEEAYGAYLSSGSTVHAPGVTQLSREYEGQSVSFSILNTSENTIHEVSGIPSNAMKGDTFSIVLSQIKGRKTVSSVPYSVTVVKEEGAKLWLTDFSGNGFIVKR